MEVTEGAKEKIEFAVDFERICWVRSLRKLKQQKHQTKNWQTTVTDRL